MIQRKLLSSIGVIALVVIFIFLSRSSPILMLKSGVVWIFRPVLEVVALIGHGFGQGVPSPTGDDSGRLATENERLRQIEQQYQMLQDQDAALRKIVGFKEKQRVLLQGAYVMLYGNEFGKEFLMVDAGVEQKIREGYLVIDNRGSIVGIIREAGSESAKVSIASNPGEAFEVVLAPLNIKALAKGIGNHTFSLELIPDEMPVRSGDFALMPGRLGNSGAAVAEVTRITSSGVGAFQDVQGTLIVHPETLDEVFIVVE